MLLGSDAGQRLKDVSVVSRTFLQSPVAHRGGDGVGDAGIELLATLDRALQRLEGRLRQACPHFFFIERVDAEQRRAGNFAEVQRGRIGLVIDDGGDG